MRTKEITVLMVEPGQHPKVTTLKDDLDSQPNAVSRVLEGCVEKMG